MFFPRLFHLFLPLCFMLGLVSCDRIKEKVKSILQDTLPASSSPAKEAKPELTAEEQAMNKMLEDPKVFEAAPVAPLPKANSEPKRFVREFRPRKNGIDVSGLTVGQLLTVSVFEGVDAVDVTGTTKGRGTAGVMKRHGFKGQRATHGVKKVHRHQGGTGQNTSPGRVFKGKRMAGRYGNERSTMRNVKLVRVDKDSNLLLVRGAVPGPNGAFVTVLKTNKIKRVGVAAPAGKKKGGAK
jgi:50S ribosomal protein uL3